MCSRYTLTSPPEAVRSYFRTANRLDFPPRYNIAPTQPVLIVRNAASSRDQPAMREMTLVRWGLIPPWVKNPAEFTTILNARCETVAEKPSFRGAIRHRRCLVPADGYYEWTGPTGAKQPHLIKPVAAAGSSLMAFAGLWEHWIGADGSELETMAIVTTAANCDTAHIHDRMPVILPPEVFDTWLDTSPGSATPVAHLLAAPQDGRLETMTVTRRLNSARNEGPTLHDPAAAEAGPCQEKLI